MADVLLASMQKTGVKTLSIIDTISELATDKTEASRLTLPSPVIRVSSSTPGTPHAQNKSKQTLLLTGGVKPGGQPGVPPRNPKVSVPFYSPNVSSLLSTSTTKSNNNTTTPHQSPAATQDNSILGGSVHVRSKSLFNGAKPRFFATSSPKNSPSATTPATATAVSSAKHLNLSAISRHQSSNNGHHLPPPHPPPASANSSSSTSFVQTPKSVTNASTTSTSRGQTPDWIRDIFLQAKRGNREKLELVTEGLESTLIRNLTDHLGNNLLHCVCSAGHTPLLPLLTSRFGNELTGALSDENRKGLTPVQIAIKLGRLECVQWLVRHTNLRDKLTSRDGDRSLLHMGAKYGKEELVRWLAEEMSHQGIDVDQLDLGANSPLHLAAKEGYTSSVAVLLNFGAMVGLKNDMGLKPHDCAKLMGKKDCAEFLILYETSLDMSKELSEAQLKKDALMAEHNELRSYFKDVLNLSKRLAKERDEMGRELRRLHENTLDLHDKMIMQIQVLKTDTITSTVNSDNEKPIEIIEACNHLHEKWQQHSRQYYNSFALNEAEQKLWMAEESWRKSKSSSGTTSGSGPSSLQQQDQQGSYAQRNLRDRIEDMKGRSLALPSASRLAALASSDEEDDEFSELARTEDSNDYEDLETKSEKSKKLIRTNIAQRKKLATPSPSQMGAGSRASLDESLYSSLSNEVYSKIQSPPLPPGGQQSMMKTSGLMSTESGTASVIEVIEPTASEEAAFKQAFKEMNWLGGGSIPRDHANNNNNNNTSLRITTVSAGPSPMMGTSRHHARPVQVRSPTLSKTSRDSYGSGRYSSNGELSPTKRLLEMGIHTSSIDHNAVQGDLATSASVTGNGNNHIEDKTESRSSSIRSNKKLSPNIIQMYANIQDHDEVQHHNHHHHHHLGHHGEGVVEEHVLPDNFDDEEHPGGGSGVVEPKSSVSPASRKSASSHTSKGSEDSGISIPVKTNATINTNNNVSMVHHTMEPKFKLGEEANNIITKNKSKKIRENSSMSKAWYDVPSDDDTEAPEADSLASIISHRGSSDEEHL